MNRTFAFAAAVLLSAFALGSTAFAAPIGPLSFSLRPAGQPGKVQLTLRTDPNRQNNVMNSTFSAEELQGLTPSWGRGGPLRFALPREAGRIDCAGTSRALRASGSCRFTRSAAFTALLVQSGMVRPTDQQALALTMIDARGNLVDALRTARFPMPSVDSYIAMTAVGVTPAYIRGLERAGYRPDDSRRLIEFKALNVSPDYLAELARAGYANLPQSEVIQFAAMKIDPDFIRGFDRIGYRNLSASKLVQLKALNVTPEFVQAVRRSGMANPTVDQLIQLKAIGFAPAARRR